MDHSNLQSGDFESYYNNVLASPEIQQLPPPWVFAQLPTDEERVKFVLQNLNGLSIKFRKDFNFAQKDRAESQELRNLGNQEYQKNKLQEALDYYNQSICLAPHPPPPNAQAEAGHDEGRFEELALGFANRSEVLFRLKEYELCIRDITRAFDNGYPNNLMYKLFERKARCLKELGEYPQALESMKSAEMWMKKKPDTKKEGVESKVMEKSLLFLEEKVAAMNVSEFSANPDHQKAMYAPVKILPMPEVKGSMSKEVPCMRSDIKLCYSESRGRHLVATRDIPPGKETFSIDY